jgi:hypothetical protein
VREHTSLIEDSVVVLVRELEEGKEDADLRDRVVCTTYTRTSTSGALSRSKEIARTGVTRYAASGASRGEEDEDIAEEVDVVLERGLLVGRELLLRRVELEPGDWRSETRWLRELRH